MNRGEREGFLGSFRSFLGVINDLEGYCARCQKKWGDVFHLSPLGVTGYTVIADPNLVAEFYSQPAENLSDYPANQFAESVFGSESTIFQSGMRHEVDRGRLRELFKEVEITLFYEAVREEVERRVGEGTKGGEMDLFSCFRKSFRHGAARYLFGEDDLDFFEQASDQLLESHGSIGALFWSDRKARQAKGFQYSELKLSIDEWIQTRWNSTQESDGKPASILAGMKLQPWAEECEWPVISDMLFTLFLTIYVPPSACAAWTVARTLESEDRLGRVREEISRPKQAGNNEPVIDSILFEVMRLHNPLPFTTRHVTSPFEAGGRQWLPGSRFLLASFLMHRDARYWENPETFDETRFFNEGASHLSSNAFTPFGGGMHRCLGRHLAVPLNAIAVRQYFESSGEHQKLIEKGSYKHRFLAGANIPGERLRVRFK